MSLPRAARIASALCALSILALFISHMALSDIYHGEADPSQEWRAVRVCFASIVVFQVAALFVLARSR